MIRRNPSNLNSSITDNPINAEHLTAVEGIRTDRPVTGMNNVVNSVNFELANDNTYELRNPLIIKDNFNKINILTYDKHSEFVYDGISVLIHTDDTTVPVRLKITGSNNVSNIFDIPENYDESWMGYCIKLDNVKHVNTHSSTILYNVECNLEALERYSGLPLINSSLYDVNNLKFFRMFSLYLDETEGWILEMMNPELNTFTGDVNSPINFNPNITLDNPYAIRDLYKYGGNSVTQILPYIAKDNISNVNYTLVKSGTVDVRLEKCFFEVSVNQDRIVIVTKLNLLNFNPKFLDSTMYLDEHLDILNSSDAISIDIKIEANGTTYYNTFKYKHYIPAGTMLCGLQDEFTFSGPVKVEVYVKGTSKMYLIPAEIPFKDFATYTPKEYVFENYVVEFEQDENTLKYIPIGNDLRFFDLDLTIDNGNLVLNKISEDTEPSFIAMSTTPYLNEESAKKDMRIFTAQNVVREFKDNTALYIYIWNSDLQVLDTIPDTVAELTETVYNPKYKLAESINVNNTDSVILKAFVTTQILDVDHYCIWEFSQDGGVTWSIAPEFVVKFKDSLVEIPIQDLTQSNESLENADKYIKYIKMYPFKDIDSEKDLTINRPDVLSIPGNHIKYKYRFSIYRYATPIVKEAPVENTFLTYSLNGDRVFKVNNHYISSNIPYNTLNTETDTISMQDWLYIDTTLANAEAVWMAFSDSEYPTKELSYIWKTSTRTSYVDSLGNTHRVFKISFMDLECPQPRYYKFKFKDENTGGEFIDGVEVSLIMNFGSQFDDICLESYMSMDVGSFYNTNIATFIPQLVFKTLKENCTGTYVPDDVTTDFETHREVLNMPVDVVNSGNANAYHYAINMSNSLKHYIWYEYSAELFNNSNIPQVLYLTFFKYPETFTGLDGTSNINLYELEFSKEETRGTLKIDMQEMDLHFETYGPTNSIITNFDMKNKRSIVIPAHTKVLLDLSVVIAMQRSEDAFGNYIHYTKLFQKGIMPVSFRTLSNTYILNNVSTYKDWFIYKGFDREENDAFSLIPSTSYTNVALSKGSIFTNSNIYGTFTQELPTSFKTTVEDSNMTTAILISQKEYAFTITNTPTKTLEPKRIPLETGEVLYHNNRLFFYGIKGYDNYIYVSDIDSFIVPMYNTIDLSYGFTVTKLLPWRSYLAIFTTNNIYLASQDESELFTSKLITNNVGVSKEDAETAVNVLNSIIFKSNNKVYKLLPNTYSSTDTIMNISCISSNIDILDVKGYNNFAFSTNEKYYLFNPGEEDTLCYIYDYTKRVWTLNSYPVVLTDFDFVNVSDIRVRNSNNIYYFNRTLKECVNDITDSIQYADYINLALNPTSNKYELDLTIPTGINFSIDFGQKSSNYSENKQFLGTRIILGTLSEKDMFPFDIFIYTDGMPRTIHIDSTTDSAIWKTSLDSLGVLNTRFLSDNSQSTGTLRQVMLKYSGRGKTIRHYLRGVSKHKFRFYSLDYKYRSLPNK